MSKIEKTPIFAPDTVDMMTYLKDKIVLAASHAFPDTIHITKQDVLNLTDCGINVGIQETSVPAFLSIFARIAESENKNLGIIQSSPFLHLGYSGNDGEYGNYKQFVAMFYDVYTKDAEPSIDKINDVEDKIKSNDKGEEYLEISNRKLNGNLLGWQFADRPSYSSLAALKSQVEEFREIPADRLLYMNFEGKMLKNYVGDSETYEKYLGDVLNDLQPNVYSIILHPLTIEKGKWKLDFGTLYTDLNASAAIFNEQPDKLLWAYIPCYSSVDKEEELPVPSEAYLRFMAFTALGYGAQGIVWHTFCKYKNSDNRIYTLAPVDLDGKRTILWKFIKNINEEIIALNDIFKDSYVCYCMHVYSNGSEQKIKKESFANERDMSDEPLVALETGTEGVQVSIIQKREANYVMIVNHDIEHYQTIIPEFSSDYKIYEITAKEGNTRKFTWPPAPEDTSITLRPGGYKIFQYER